MQINSSPSYLPREENLTQETGKLFSDLRNESRLLYDTTTSQIESDETLDSNRSGLILAAQQKIDESKISGVDDPKEKLEMLVGALQPKFQLLLRLRTHFLSLQNPDAQDRIFFDSLVRAVTMQINHVMTKYIAEKTRLHAFMKQYTIFTPNGLNIKSLLSIYSMFGVDFVDTPHSSSKVIENVRNGNFGYLWYKVKQKTLNSFEFGDNTFTIQPNDTMKDGETRKEKKIKSEYNEGLSDYSIYTVEKDGKKNGWMVHSKDGEINYSTFERPLPLQSWKKSENRRAVNNWKVNYAEQVSKPHIFSGSFTMTDAKGNNPGVSLMNGTLRNYSEIPTSRDGMCFFKDGAMKIVNKREKFNWSDIGVTSSDLQSAKEYISSLPQELSDIISSKLDPSYTLNIYENVHDNFLFFELIQFLKMSVATVSLQVHDGAIQVVEKLPKEHSRYFVTLQDGGYIIAEVFADSLTAIKTIMKYVSEDLEGNKKVDDIVLMDTGIFSKGSLSGEDVSISGGNSPYNIVIME